MNNMVEYLKEISNSKVTVKEDKYEFDELDVRLLLTSVSCSDKHQYTVCLVCNDEDKQIIYDNIMLKKFTKEKQAKKYYESLKKDVNSNYIRKLLSEV